MSKYVTLGEQFQKQTFEALALQVPGGHCLIFATVDLHMDAGCGMHRD